MPQNVDIITLLVGLYCSWLSIAIPQSRMFVWFKRQKETVRCSRLDGVQRDAACPDSVVVTTALANRHSLFKSCRCRPSPAGGTHLPSLTRGGTLPTTGHKSSRAAGNCTDCTPGPGGPPGRPMRQVRTNEPLNLPHSLGCSWKLGMAAAVAVSTSKNPRLCSPNHGAKPMRWRRV